MLLRKGYRIVKSRYIKALGLGYVKRRITAGPVMDRVYLIFLLGRRSKSTKGNFRKKEKQWVQNLSRYIWI